MLNKIIHWSISNKLIVGVLTIGLIIWGSFSLNELPIDAVPDITNNQIQIVTTSPSSGAEDIERFVTFPIEQTMATIPGIEEIRSFSRFGLSVCTVVFKEDIDIYWARQQVQERLVEAKGQIAEGFGTPTMAPLSTGLGEIYQYIVKAEKGYEKKFNATELRTIQDWIIRRQLLGVEGVADVSGFGGNVKQYEISLDPVKLRGLGLTVSDVFRAVEKNNQNTGGAYIERFSSTTYIRTEGIMKSVEDIQKTIVTINVKGIPVLVRDVASVRIGSAVRYGALTSNTDGEAVGGIVLMLKGANSSKVIEDVKNRMEQIKKTLPQGVKLKVYLDRTKLVNKAIATVSKNLIEGALIVIFVLVLLLGNFRAGLIVASVIPLAMLFAISLMNIFGVSGNLMSLGALDFGLIVDGAVIIVESTLHFIYHHGNTRLNQKQLDDQVYQSASKFSKSAVFGQIIILVVYLPLLVLIGIEGKMFKPMAQTVMFAILGALILSLTYVPMISSVFLSKKIVVRETISDRIIKAIRSIYTPSLNFLLKKQRTVVASIVGLLVISSLIFSNLGAEFIPSLDEGDFAVEMRLLTGSSLTATVEATENASEIILKNFPEVEQVVGKIGTAEIPTDPMPMEACDLMIILKDKDEWTSASNKEELAEKMQMMLEDNLPGVSFGFQQPIQMRFNELMTGAKQDVVVKVYGEDLDKLSDYAGKIGGLCSKINGVQDVYVEQMTGLPQMIVSYDRDALSRFGIDIEDVNRSLNISFAGQAAGLIFEGEKRFELVVKLDSTSRANIDDLRSITVTSPTGVQVPLDQLANVQYKKGPNQIQRDDAQRRIIVGFNVRGRDVQSIVKELQASIDRNVQFEPGYYPTYGGTFKNLENATARLKIAVPAALFMIFFLLYLTFQSLKQAVLIFSAIPLAAVGGILALWLRDMPFSISAGVGFIALFGVAVLNGIVLISEFNSLKREGYTNKLRIVLMGTRVRLRPVLLTALVASLGFLPMAISHGSGAEVQKPLATVVIGGLVTATILTLFVLPIFYLISERKTKKMKSAVLILFPFLFAPFIGSTQVKEVLSIDQCVSRMKENNGRILSGTLQPEIEVLTGKMNGGLPKTTIGAQYGQMNSFYNKDNNINISQTLPFPTVLSKERQLGVIRADIANNAQDQQIRDLQLELLTVCEELILLKTQLKLMSEQDSILGVTEKIAKSKNDNLEISTVDLMLIQSKRMQYRNDLIRMEKEISMKENDLQVLIGSKTPVTVNEELMARIKLNSFDTTSISEHPQLKYYELNRQTLSKEKEVIGARALPDLSFGYVNMTLVGMHSVLGVDKEFFQGDRFQSGQIALEIPIFFGAYKRGKEVIDLKMEQNSFNLEYQRAMLYSAIESEVEKFQGITMTVEQYETKLIPQLTEIELKTQLSYKNGEISMIELLQIRQLVVETKIKYTQSISEMNISGYKLNWLTNKN